MPASDVPAWAKAASKPSYTASEVGASQMCIRDSHLGDAAFSGRSFQEALQLIYNEANGSTTKMKELLGTDEALQLSLIHI